MNSDPSGIVRAERLGKQVRGPAGDLEILADIDLSVSRGECLAVLGVSGSGKSTLLGLLAGLDVPSAGRTWLDGIELTQLDEDGRAGARNGRVGFVFQSFQLLPSLDAMENVMLPLELAGAGDAAARARDRLEAVGLGHRLRHYPNQLSGGEQQRVAIARAFAIEPRVLFADEPTGNLDQQTGQQVIEHLFKLNREHGTTLLLVTHDPAIAEYCDRQLTLDGGRISGETRIARP